MADKQMPRDSTDMENISQLDRNSDWDNDRNSAVKNGKGAMERNLLTNRSKEASKSRKLEFNYEMIAF